MCTYEYPRRTEKGTKSPKTGLPTVVRQPIRGWEPQMSPLEEHQEHLATEAHFPRSQTSNCNLLLKAVHFEYNVLFLCQTQGGLKSWSCLHPDYRPVLPHWTLRTSFPQFSSCSLTVNCVSPIHLAFMLWNPPLPSEAPFTTTALKLLWSENLACVYPLRENSHY